jgi:CTP synthase (UTP-ammonia lyase)
VTTLQISGNPRLTSVELPALASAGALGILYSALLEVPDLTSLAPIEAAAQRPDAARTRWLVSFTRVVRSPSASRRYSTCEKFRLRSECELCSRMPLPLRIAIVGDFERTRFSHWATEASLFHAAAQLGASLELRWVSTDQVARLGAARCLAEAEGIWGAPGTPLASNDGMLSAVRFARESGLPYLGTCAGFQYALIELTRSLLGIPDADSAENGSSSEHIVITPVGCPLPNRRPEGPLMSGSEAVIPVASTLLAQLCGTEPLLGEYNCSFETNEEYVPRWQAAGLCVTARDERGALRAFTLPASSFFLATLFQPQLSSRPQAPHPIIIGFLRACRTGTSALLSRLPD